MDDFRLQKAQALRKSGNQPYASKFERSHTLSDASKLHKKKVAVAGRIKLWREMGKMIFGTLQDHTGTLQIALKSDEIDASAFESAKELIDLGDFIGVHGEMFETQKGEPTVMVKEWEMLSKALRQPPEKWHGVHDQETSWRQRYLDTMSNRETFDRFLFRSDFIKRMREFYWSHDFVEVDTPILVNAASGALATPFETHHAAYDIDVFLRIAPEVFLKECIVGGYDRVFEVARCFRNEGLDPSHLQDFTMAEHYSAYWNYEQNMQFTEQMLSTLIKEMTGSTNVKIPDRDGNLVEVDFKAPWPRISIQEAIQKECGIDVHATETADDLRKEIGSKKIKLDVDIAALGRGNLIDQLYKKVSRPHIVQPTFLTQHPIELSPLARLNDENPKITDRFQLVVGGWEIVNAYSELIDPVDQAQRFEKQAQAHAGGDSDAHDKDDEYVKALSYGCPPCSGWGMGVDRIVALLTQQTNLRDVVLFPLMKPFDSAQGKPDAVPSSNANAAATTSLPDETKKRFVAVLNKKIEPGKLMNALGHMTAGISKLVSDHDEPCFIQYQDKDGTVHPNISHYPFIVLKADNGNKIRTVRTKALEKGILFTDFTDTMTVGTSSAQQDATMQKAEGALEYYGICLFGTTEELKELTGKFSLFG